MSAIDTSDRAALRRQRRLEKQRKERLDNAVRKMVEDADLREYIWWLLEIGKVGAQPFGDSDARTNFQCGELNVGTQIFAHLTEVSPDGYIKIVKEQQYDRNLTRPDRDSPADADDADSDD